MTAVVIPTPQRRVDVTGTDRARYLEDVTSQHLLEAAEGEVRGTLYLDPNGAPLAVFDVAVLADRFALLTPDDEVATTAVEVLGSRTFLLDVTFAATDDTTAALRGDGAVALASAAGLPSPAPGTCVDGELLVIGRDAGLDLVGPPDRVDHAVRSLLDAGVAEGDADDLEAWRVTRGVPAWGREIVAPHLPEEAGLLATHVHLAKGCYPGQEAIARMWMLGRPRRRLALVAAVDGPVAVGWEAGEGRRRVTVTSVTPAGDRALAFVPGDAGPGDAFRREDGAAVEVVQLVGADDRPPGHDPGMTRRRDRRR